MKDILAMSESRVTLGDIRIVPSNTRLAAPIFPTIPDIDVIIHNGHR
jgi:hypothetical protein